MQGDVTLVVPETRPSPYLSCLDLPLYFWIIRQNRREVLLSSPSTIRITPIKSWNFSSRLDTIRPKRWWILSKS